LPRETGGWRGVGARQSGKGRVLATGTQYGSVVAVTIGGVLIGEESKFRCLWVIVVGLVVVGGGPYVKFNVVVQKELGGSCT
jgi:hypothetical protein